MNPLKQTPIDVWSIREKLSLASSVLTAGDQNWYSVSRSLKPFGEDKRPTDWFSQKNCALQYAELLENVETPKRKRGERNEDTVQNLIVRKLTLERINELKSLIEKEKKDIDFYEKNLKLLKNEVLSEADFKNLENIMVEYLDDKKKEGENYQIWIKEREEKYASLLINKKKVSSISSKIKQDTLPPSLPTTPLTSNIVTLNYNLAVEDQNKDTPKKVETNDSIKLLSYNVDTGQSNEEIIKNDDNEQKKCNVLSPSLLSPAQNYSPKTEVIQQINTDKKTKDKKIEIDEKIKDQLKNKIKTSTTSITETLNKKQEGKNNEELVNELKEKDINKTSDKQQLNEIINEKVIKNITNKVETDKKLNIEINSDKSVKQEKVNQSLTVDKTEDTSLIQNEIVDTSSLDSKIESQKRKRVSLSTNYTPTRRSGRVKVLRISNEAEDQKKNLENTNVGQFSSLTSNNNLPSVQTTAVTTNVNEDKKFVHSDETNDSTTSDIEAFKTAHSKTLSVTESVPNSPASTVLNIEDQEQLKEYKTWKKSILLLWRQAATHKYSSLFTYPVTDEEAKGYSTVVYRPIDLTTIKKKIENGTIRNTPEFQRDVMLMFQNAIMYNSAKHEVHQMAIEMQKEVIEGIEDFIESQQNNNLTSSNNNSDQRQRARRSNISLPSANEIVSDSNESLGVRRKSRTQI